MKILGPSRSGLSTRLFGVALIVGISSSPVLSQSFNDTGDILARSAEVEDIDYKIMVQRATQTAIWGMPAAGMIDFLKGIRRDLGGDYNDIIYLNKPFDSKHGFLTANDVTAYAWASMTSEPGPLVIEVP
ncbi:hypothetical protein, partial [Ruegeria conchae]